MKKTIFQEQKEARDALDAFLAEIFRVLRFQQLFDWLNKTFFK